MPPFASSSSPFRSWSATGERPLDVTEELALDQTGTERGEGDWHERPIPPGTVAVDCPGDELLAGSALTGDQDGHVGRSDQRDALEKFLHGRRCADQCPGFLGRRPWIRVGDFSFFQGALHDGGGLVEVERLDEIVEGPPVQCRAPRSASSRRP